jgi:hypothetical protein
MTPKKLNKEKSNQTRNVYIREKSPPPVEQRTMVTQTPKLKNYTNTEI